MNNLKLTLLTGLSVLVAATSFSVSADEVTDRIEAAMANSARSEADSARDPIRKPTETIAFVGITTGMSVIDISASAGWYTEMLAAAVGPTGSVLAQNGSRFAARVGPALAEKAERFPNITPLIAENADGYGIDGQMDAAWTALNLHDSANRSREGGLEFLGAIYDSLKPGGVIGLIDHTGIAGADNQALHRIEADTAIGLLREVGFVVDAQAYMLNDPTDDHSLRVQELVIDDRFILKAHKPGM